MSVAAIASTTISYSIVITGNEVTVVDCGMEIMTAQHREGVVYGARWRPRLDMSTTARSMLIMHVQRQVQQHT
ncbi:hypothetical protein GCM10029992_28020 [Glycomyces albus]